MKIREVKFIWKSGIEDDLADYSNMKRLEIMFNESQSQLIIETRKIKIEDRSIEFDSKEILKKIGEIDFKTSKYQNYSSMYSGEIWELYINNQKYEGVLDQPEYVSKVKKIIKYNIIWTYANRKLAKYIMTR